MSQKGDVFRHLRMFGSITTTEAYERYGIMRLASRIDELRKMLARRSKAAPLEQVRHAEGRNMIRTEKCRDAYGRLIAKYVLPGRKEAGSHDHRGQGR